MLLQGVALAIAIVIAMVAIVVHLVIAMYIPNANAMFHQFDKLY